MHNVNLAPPLTPAIKNGFMTTLIPSFPDQAEHIRDIERTRLKALVSGDVSAAGLLHADDFQLVTPIGALLSKAEYLGAIAASQIKYLYWEPGAIEVRLTERAATIRYTAELEVIFGAHHVPRAHYWHTDTYELSASGWQAVWSQATQIVEMSPSTTN